MDTPQIYVGMPANSGEAPRRLAGFEKVALQPKESRTVTATIDPRLLAVFDVKGDQWQVAAGSYPIQVGHSSRDLVLNGAAAVTAARLHHKNIQGRSGVTPSMQDQTCRVRLIAPSGYPHDRDAMTRGVWRAYRQPVAPWRDWTCSIVPSCVMQAATRSASRTSIPLATLDTLPDIALSIRGGYGVTRLLEHVRYDALRERLAGAPMVLVGHSDFTALQMALYAKSSLFTFGGPMLGPDFGPVELSPLTWRNFWRTISAPQGQGELGLRRSGASARWKGRYGAAILPCCAACSTHPIFHASKAASCSWRTWANRRSASSECFTSCIYPAC